ncbi:hypothetical protein Sjap_009261 [Stephania japonica]|uniref:Uncharacterized protein n=1 Tax=Stephania japonica TaxID=461633 RepID=A0AAP0PC42_9MAGN
MILDGWTLERSVKDMKKWMRNAITLTELAQLLSKSCLHFYAALSESLLKAFSEVFEIINFVDIEISYSRLRGKLKSKLAKSLWESRNFNKVLLSKIVKKIGKEAFETKSHLDQATLIILCLYKATPSDYVWEELKLVTECIQHSQAYGSIEELYSYMEQLFVGMLNEFLSQFPNAIFKYINESPVEEYEGRVKFAVKLICKIEQLEGHVLELPLLALYLTTKFLYQMTTYLKNLISWKGGSKMRSQGCVNGTLDEANYSSPMPMIGLYVAAATLVCLLFMLFDILAGFREKKRWIPCRFFPLNSVTLTLLAIATKLPQLRCLVLKINCPNSLAQCWYAFTWDSTCLLLELQGNPNACRT